VPKILRVIIPGLAQYHSAVFGKNIIINGLWVLAEVQIRQSAHAQYTNVSCPRKSERFTWKLVL